MRALQLGAGLDAQLVDEGLACPGVLGERFRLAAVPVQREQQLRTQALAQRLFRNERLQLGHELGVTADGKVGVDACLDCRQPQLREPHTVHLGLAPPERKRVSQPVGRDVRLRVARRLDEVLEPREIDLLA